MDIEKLRVKIFSRATSPIEIAYDVTRHWFLVLFALSIGTLVVFAKTTSEPTYFECTATLKVEPNRITAIDSDFPRPSTREAELAFIDAQLSLLQSDSVFGYVVKMLGSEIILQQDEDRTPKPGAVQKAYKAIEKMVTDVIGNLEGSSSEGDPRERARQTALAAFRRRTYASNAVRPANIFRIGVVGNLRENLSKELNAWIEAYKNRLREMNQDAYKALFDELIKKWTGEVRSAKEALDEFVKANPTASTVALDSNREKLMKLNFYIDQTQYGDDPRALIGPAGPGAFARVPGEEVIGALKTRQETLRVELAEMLAKNPEESMKYQQKKLELDSVTNEILKERKRLDEAAVADETRASREVAKEVRDAPKSENSDANPKPKDRLTRLKEDREKTIADQAKLENVVGQLNVLKEIYTRAQETLRQYHSLRDRREDFADARMQVDVQVQDPPTTSINPGNPSLFKKVPIGSGIGLGAGLLLAFLIEFFNRRIRYKRDIETELGLTVLGVIPEN